MIAFDARLNPGCSEKIQRQFALTMLKNIEKMRAKGLTIKKDWLKPELYAYSIPPAILKGLGLKNVGEKDSRRKTARARSTSQVKRTGSLAGRGSAMSAGEQTQGSNQYAQDTFNGDFSQINI